MIYVLYDGGGCVDGFGAAFAFWLKFGDKAAYLPVEDRRDFKFPHPLQKEEDSIYIVDTSFPREVILRWKDICDVTLLDHHLSASRELAGLDFCHFDMTKSGCMMAWDFLHKDDPVALANPPELLLHIQDRDLWKFKIQGTKEVMASLYITPKDFSVWNGFLDEDKLDDLYYSGRDILKHQEHYVKEKAEKATLVGSFTGHMVPIVNTTIYHSELGDELCKRFPASPYSITFSVVIDDGAVKYRCSLRSTNPNIDVSEIAKQLGGGGHKSSAGMTIDNLGSLFVSL